jgi:uncharacterized membrane protein YbhN (UPF0104 family)
MQTRRILLQSAKVIVSLGLIVFLLMKISPGRLVTVMEATRPGYLVLAFSIFFASGLLGSFQWHLLLRAGGIALPFSKSFQLYFVGLFFNNFLPANVGGDIVKIYDVSRFGNDPHQVLAITLLDRVIGITGLCLLAAVASLLLIGRGGIDNLRIYLIVFAGCIAPIVALTVNRRLSGVVKGLFRGITWWGLGGRFGIIFEHLGGFRRLRILLLKLTLLAIVVQLLRVGTHIAVGKALGIAMSPETALYFFVFIPLLGLLMILPISINGLGVREGTSVLLFVQIGLLAEQAFLMEFITYVVMVGVSLVGGAIFLKRHLRRLELAEGERE